MSLPDIISVASGAVPIYGGRAPPSLRPAWRQAMAIGTVAEIPMNTLSSVSPALDPALNANYPSVPQWNGLSGFGGIVNAWNSAVWDESTFRLFIFLAGGHADYAGNEPYRATLNVDAPAFQMFAPPSGRIGDGVTINDGNEDSGVYSDGNPRPVHTYNNQLFVPGIGPMLVRQPGPYPGIGNVLKAWTLNPETGAYTLFKDWTGTANAGTFFSGTAHDPTRNCVWIAPSGPAQLCKMNLSTKAVTTHGTLDNHLGGYVRALYIPGHDILVTITGGSNGYVDAGVGLSVWNLSTFAHTVRTFTGSFAAGYSLSGAGGVAWDNANQRLLLWNNATNRAQISTLSPTGNLTTDPWIAGSLPVAPGNTFEPTVAPSGGTYGRFFYSPGLGGCFLLNGVSQKPAFFATE